MAADADHPFEDPDALAEHLARLAERLRADAPVDGGSGGRAELAALLPCEPVVGPVAVVAWRSADGADEAWELVRLDAGDAGGERLDDQAALRESLALHGMLETVEELARPAVIDALAAAIAAWQDAIGRVRGSDAPAATAVAAGDEDGRGVALDGALAQAHARASSVADLACEPGTVRLASTARLDALTSALLELERAWTALEQAAEGWSEATFAAAGGDIAARELVQELWQVLTLARRGVLSQPVTGAVQAGREAGVALAGAVTAPGVGADGS